MLQYVQFDGWNRLAMHIEQKDEYIYMYMYIYLLSYVLILTKYRLVFGNRRWQLWRRIFQAMINAIWSQMIY